MARLPITVLDPSIWGDRARLDHCSELRLEPEALVRLWARKDARVVDIDAHQHFRTDPLGEPAAGALGPDTVFLGTVDAQPWFARRSALIEDGDTLRSATLDAARTQVAMAGAAALNWASIARFCERCGGELERTQGGFAATCRSCQRQSFPRTDPAIIVAVLDTNDRLFLAHQTTWTSGRVSILAGFAEAGESVENAVHREVGEESQLRLSALRYLGSQPWPFPRSLMLGFCARGVGPGQVDGVELEWGEWFSRAALEARLDDGSLEISAVGSIARRLIDAWRVGSLPAPEW